MLRDVSPACTEKGIVSIASPCLYLMMVGSFINVILNICTYLNHVYAYIHTHTHTHTHTYLCNTSVICWVCPRPDACCGNCMIPISVYNVEVFMLSILFRDINDKMHS